MKEYLFDIDRNALDEAWLNQPKLYSAAALALAAARADLESAKADHELVMAELDHEIRKNPGKYGLEKISEASVEKAIIREDDYQKSLRKMLDAKDDVNTYQVQVDTLDHRKYALQDLVKLHLADYFSQPQAPKGHKEEMDNVVKRHVRKKGQKVM